MAPTSRIVTPVSTSATLRYVPTVACAPSCGWSVMRCASRDQVDEREDRDPHDVHEVPVEPGHFHLDGVGPAEPAAKVEHPERQKPDHTDRHVPTVEAREHEEGRAEEILLQRQALPDEVRELVSLEAEEDQTEERG